MLSTTQRPPASDCMPHTPTAHRGLDSSPCVCSRRVAVIAVALMLGVAASASAAESQTKCRSDSSLSYRLCITQHYTTGSWRGLRTVAVHEPSRLWRRPRNQDYRAPRYFVWVTMSSLPTVR